MKIKEFKQAIELYKNKRPVYNKKDTDEYWLCPNCTQVVSTIHREKNNTISYKTNPCCHVCGQHLDWYVFTPDGK